MLDYACQRAVEVLKLAHTAVLASQGPAGLQLGEYPCESLGLAVYLLLPQTSDQVFNLENNPGVSLLTPFWQVSGDARVVTFEPVGLKLLQALQREWSVLVRIRPARIQVTRERGWGQVETIDLTQPPDAGP